ncbi:GAF domain-containing protein [Chryseotalea sanaruensis]|nr:GAF domain-containing protein [Chryseotalea sanaruensis]
MTLAISISLVIVALTIWMHSLGFHYLTRLLVSVLPVLVSSCIQGAYQMNNQLPNASAWVFIVGFQVLPFLLFDPSEKKFRLVSICLNIAIAFCYEQFNQWIELAQIPFTPPIQVFITIAIGLLLVIGLLSAMDNIFVKTNKENIDLIKRVEQEKEEQNRSQEKLNHTLEELNKSKIEEEKRIWAAKGVADIVKIMQESDDLNAIADKALIYLVKTLKANQAGLFLIEGNEENQLLEMKACYAFQRKKYLKKQVAIGEGLLGQCYLEKEHIYLIDVPEDYILIGSGLGDSKPRCILLIPLLANDVVYGVMEIASFKEFKNHEVTFLLEVGENIAMTVRSIKTNEQTQTLLYETQAMAEQMKSQEEEMRQSMEEIAATQEELTRTEEELKEEIKVKNEQILFLEQKLKKLSPTTLEMAIH